MSLKSLPIPEEILAKLLKEKQEKTGTNALRVRRSTYSRNNAEQMRKIFDAIASTGMAQEVPFSSLPGVSIGTLYQKLIDALKYLSDTEGGRYTEIRTHYKVKRLSESYVIVPRFQVLNPSHTGTTINIDQTSTEWRNQITEFIESDSIGIREFTNLKPSDADKLWLSGFLHSVPGVDYMFKENETKLMISKD